MADPKQRENPQRTGRDLDRDPETGQPEDHAGGMAGGAFAGGAAGGIAGAAVIGAATGSIAGGPLGTAVGAAVGVVAGSVIGAITGKAVAERVNPQHEDDHWRAEFPSRPYAHGSHYGWDDYRSAYRYGYERFPLYGGRPFEDIEPELSGDWDQYRGTSRMDWAEARAATRDAYERMLRSNVRASPPAADGDVQGDVDRDAP